ncbi:hypothetical protein [Rubeoparvulum massiliense]|uniref:hypothetical protein n=1 Tax=Rubeoparvulum massiliense TaxID=1631346 RepID=UPI00065E0C5E|nr:hypothetical protein [Rubeoparvulum massiliense]
MRGSVERERGWGVGLTSSLLLLRWIDGSIIILSYYYLQPFGLLGLAISLLVSSLLLLTYPPLMRWIEKNQQGFWFLTEQERLRNRQTSKGKRGSLLFLSLFSSGWLLLFHSWLIAGILVLVLQPPIWTAYLLLLLLVLFITLFLSEGRRVRLIPWELFILFLSSILLPLFFFVRHGVEPVYQGIRLYHPYMLVLNHKAMWLAVLTAAIVQWAIYWIDGTTWYWMQKQYDGKRSKTYLAAGFLQVSLGLPLLAILAIFLYPGSYNGMDWWYHAMQSLFPNPLFWQVLIAALMIMLISSFAFELFTFKTMLSLALWEGRDQKQRRADSTHWVFIVAYALLLLGLFSWRPSPFTLFYLYQGFAVAVLPPLFVLLKGGSAIKGLWLGAGVAFLWGMFHWYQGGSVITSLWQILLLSMAWSVGTWIFKGLKGRSPKQIHSNSEHSIQKPV